MKRTWKYKTPEDKEPFSIWFSSLETRTQARIDSYIQRVRAGGSKKNVKPIDQGVFEITIDHGPGYRIYFAEQDPNSILLLTGGEKRTQPRDIEKAVEYWRAYNAEKR